MQSLFDGLAKQWQRYTSLTQIRAKAAARGRAADQVGQAETRSDRTGRAGEHDEAEVGKPESATGDDVGRLAFDNVLGVGFGHQIATAQLQLRLDHH